MKGRARDRRQGHAKGSRVPFAADARGSASHTPWLVLSAASAPATTTEICEEEQRTEWPGQDRGANKTKQNTSRKKYISSVNIEGRGACQARDQPRYCFKNDDNDKK